MISFCSKIKYSEVREFSLQRVLKKLVAFLKIIYFKKNASNMRPKSLVENKLEL